MNTNILTNRMTVKSSLNYRLFNPMYDVRHDDILYSDMVLDKYCPYHASVVCKRFIGPLFSSKVSS